MIPRTQLAPQVSAAAALEEAFAFQDEQAPKAEDQNAWLTRYIFEPFRDRPLVPEYMGLYGLSLIRKGIIQPIRPVDKPEPDYQVIKSIDPGDMTVSDGIHEMRIDKRSPKKIVEAIMRPYAFRNGQATGICEIECLRGEDDRELHRALQTFLLPEMYDTARAQINQLEQAVSQARTGTIQERVGLALLAATEVARDWAEFHYMEFVSSVEDFGQTRIGKRKASELDAAVCRWLEVPEPKLNSPLKAFTGQRQADNADVSRGMLTLGTASEPEIPAVQCVTCGEFSNLLPNNQPPKMCRACKTEFNVEAVEPAAVEDAKPAKKK